MKENLKNKEIVEKYLDNDINEDEKKHQEEINNFSFGGKIVFNDFKINLYSKYMLNIDKETKSVIPSSFMTFSHQVTPWMKYSLKEQKDVLKFCTSMSPVSNFLLSTILNVDNTEKITSTPFDIFAKYSFNNNLCFQLGIKDFNLIKDKTPNNICAGITKPFNLWGSNILKTNFFINYSLSEKLVKKMNFSFDISNTYLKTIINLNYNKKNKSNITEKNLKLNGELKISDRLTLGTEINYNSEGIKGTKLQLFTKYIIDQFTNFMGKWDDKDRSVLFKMNHDFRGLFKLGIIGKFIPVDGDKKEGKFYKLPNFSTKTGISIEISEPLI